MKVESVMDLAQDYLSFWQLVSGLSYLKQANKHQNDVRFPF